MKQHRFRAVYRVMRVFIASMVAALCVSCGNPRGATTSGPSTKPATSEFSDADWIGIYASTSEIGGFSGTVLAIEKGSFGKVGYRMRSFTDMSAEIEIKQEEKSGDCLIEGNKLYLPRASGYMLDGKPTLLPSIDRYTLVEINRRKVLMRDDPLRAFQRENKLYDYGILVKVNDKVAPIADLKKVEHPSIKILYADPKKPWQDPFVNGPNGR